MEKTVEKTKEELIAAFKKANKTRRQKMLEKNGFATPEEYFISLDGKKKRKSPPRKTPKAPKKREVLDYVVAFDTTGSMASYINNVKAHVEKLIPDMFSQDIDLKMKIVAFGDYCDMPQFGFGNAYQESEFTNDQNKLISFVKGARNTSGGDADEFYELVIKKITEETPWREGSRRAVLFIADCDPHPVGYSYHGKVNNSQIDWKEEARKAAEKGIAFDTLSIHGEVRYPWYKELSKITKGVYIPFQSAGKMEEVVAASAYVRGGAKSKRAFTAAYASAVSSGDSELIGTYKSLSTLMED